MTPDPNVYLEGAATIVLAGQEFKVPTPPLRYAMPMTDIGNEISGWANRQWTETEYTKAAKAIWLGLRVPYPDLSFDAFLDMTITPGEVAAAITTVMAQTGAFRILKPGETPGEAQAASP